MFPTRLTDDESRRAAARASAIVLLVPGTQVRVIRRVVQNDVEAHKKSFPKGTVVTGVQKSFTLEKLQLWKHPDDRGPQMALEWRTRRFDSTWKRDLERLKGPCMLLNEHAIVVANLPAQKSKKYGSQPWCLLLTSSGELGWCYALDGLEILSPVSGSQG